MEMQPPAPSVGDVPEDDETAPYDHSNDPFLDGDVTVDFEGDGDVLTTTTSRFWGVSSKAAARRTRSSTGNWCPARLRRPATGRATPWTSAAATSPPPRRRSAPAAAARHK